VFILHIFPNVFTANLPALTFITATSSSDGLVAWFHEQRRWFSMSKQKGFEHHEAIVDYQKSLYDKDGDGVITIEELMAYGMCREKATELAGENCVIDLKDANTV